jgi:GGDEF domain-containing protein
MSAPSRKQDDEVLDATLTLTQLRAQVEQSKLELQELRLQLAALRSEMNDDLGLQLRQANEQLLLATLYAEASAETAVSKLEALAQTSQRDELTNTPNRALLLDRLERSIAMAQRRYTRCAVVFLDIDHFKQINDTLGHAAGDAVLQLVRAGWKRRCAIRTPSGATAAMSFWCCWTRSRAWPTRCRLPGS